MKRQNRGVPEKLPSARTREMIETALAANDIPLAARHADAALRRGEVDAMMLNLAAWRREEEADYEGAHQLLRRALALAPGDPLILAAIGAVLRKEGAYPEALDVLESVLASAPTHASAWLERGYVLDALHRPADAAGSYRQALAIDQRLAPALGKLADGAAKAGRTAEARALASQALAISPAEPSACFAFATLEIEAKDGVSAETRLRSLLATNLPNDDRTRALTLLGDALDRQDRTRDAFAIYCAAQRNFREIYRDLLASNDERPSHRSFIERITEQVTTGHAKNCIAALPQAAATHVFLLGYPRSGTTLVENILASAANVVALEERDTLADCDGILITNDGTMPSWPDFDPATLAAARVAYWRRVGEYAGRVAGRVFVDMNPLNGTKLPIIARLFPDAKIVIMRRDPRDVILSCFRINFTPSTAAWAFSDLAEAARHYDALMRLIETCRRLLPIDCFELRYDALVSDFTTTVRSLAAFIDLPWTDDFLSFDRTARHRGVRTASAGQVRRGLYDGRGQWRRYEHEIARVLPVLRPWVSKFGFDE